MLTGNNKNINTCQSGNSHYIYDAALIDDVLDEALFQHENNLSSDNQGFGNTAPGRGDAIFFEYNMLKLVYKHYQRGGLVAKLLHDHYFGLNPDATRAFREWRLLHQMQYLGLPSPVPVAARITKSGFIYKADMVMKEIESVSTLADLCLQTDVDANIWLNVGQCIKRFHDNNVYHADLNARNILVGKDYDVSLIDFDKASIRLSNASWKTSNLSRLNRSLLKFQRLNEIFHFSENNWDQLLEGYNKPG